MGAIHHDRRGQTCFFEQGAGAGNAGGIIVGAVFTAAKNDVASRVAASGNRAGQALHGNAEESLRGAGGLYGIDGHFDIAAGGVFEAERHGEAAGHLAMGLGLCGARANGRPANEVGNVLRRDGIEQLGCSGEADVDDFEEEFTGGFEARGNVVRAIEVGVHDEAFPANGGSGLLEIDTHDQLNTIRDLGSEGGEPLGIIATCFEVMDRARADDEEETLVLSEDNFVDALASGNHGGGLRFSACHFAEKELGRREDGSFYYIDVGNTVHGEQRLRVNK